MIADVERFVRWVALIAGLLFFAAGFGAGYATARPSSGALTASTIAIAKADTVHVIAQARTDTVSRTLTRYIERHARDTAWRRDTVTLRDTLRILMPAAAVARTDSTIRACGELVTACSTERVTAGATIAALRQRVDLLERKPRFRDRLGCSAGYGAVASRDGTVVHGAAALCGLRIWP